MTQGAVWRTPRKPPSKNQIGSSTFGRTQSWWNAFDDNTKNQVSGEDDDLGSGGSRRSTRLWPCFRPIPYHVTWRFDKPKIKDQMTYIVHKTKKSNLKNQLNVPALHHDHQSRKPPSYNCWRSVPLPCGQYNGHFSAPSGALIAIPTYKWPNSTPTFSDTHRSSTLDFHFLSHYSYIKAIMLYKGNHWTHLLATCIPYKYNRTTLQDSAR